MPHITTRHSRHRRGVHRMDGRNRMNVMIIVFVVMALLVIAGFLILYSYGRFAARARGPNSNALPVEEDHTILDRAIGTLTSFHEGESGLALLSQNMQALAYRALAARTAGRSLDLMYYYWNDDLTGKLLFHEVLAAADRGVRVRILLDDMNTLGRDPIYRAIDQHSNIELRLFNPARSRGDVLRRGIELLLRAFSATRRMHNKAWIADGRLAIVGGRNIGDEYFDASQEANFRDMDLLMVGPAVQQTEQIFDTYWNSAAALPVRRLLKRTRRLARVRKRLAKFLARKANSPYLQKLREIHDPSAMLAGGPEFHWCTDVEVVADPPGKVVGRGNAEWLQQEIFPMMMAAEASLHIISPYFIPGNEGVDQLASLAKTGVDVKVSTNSLAATDVVAVHGCYSRYRMKLLSEGVKLYELRPQIRWGDHPSLFGSSNASLHTKAYVVDGLCGFIGSFNFDPRSMSLNTEMGVLFRHAPLAREVDQVFARQITSSESYRVTLEGNAIVWHDGEGSSVRTWRQEPEAKWLRRLSALVIGWLPIESQL